MLDINGYERKCDRVFIFIPTIFCDILKAH